MLYLSLCREFVPVLHKNHFLSVLRENCFLYRFWGQTTFFYRFYEKTLFLLVFTQLGSSRKLGSTCKKHPQILINVEIFGKILPEKEPKLPKRLFLGIFFGADRAKKYRTFGIIFRITLNLPYVRYFCVELRWIFFKIPYVRYFLMIFGRFFSAATTCRQISAVFSGGKHLPAIPNPLTYGFEKYRTYGNFSPIGCS